MQPRRRICGIVGLIFLGLDGRPDRTSGKMVCRLLAPGIGLPGQTNGPHRRCFKVPGGTYNLPTMEQLNLVCSTCTVGLTRHLPLLGMADFDVSSRPGVWTAGTHRHVRPWANRQIVDS
jgi:hypothetical protein